MTRSRHAQALELYEQAVQQPLATAALCARMYKHAQRHAGKQGEPDQPRLLREDFAGSAAVAAAWCESGPERQAMAIENDPPTARFAAARYGDIEGLHLLEADVAEVRNPKVDITLALNFSTFIYHDAPALLAYFRGARAGLRPGGVLILDAFGGPGAERLRTQTRPGDGFVYHWQQQRFDPLTRRLDAAIHFEVGNQQCRNAFRYHWRLWTPPELFALLRQAGFTAAQAWSTTGHQRPRPIQRLPATEDWVIHIVASKH